MEKRSNKRKAANMTSTSTEAKKLCPSTENELPYCVICMETCTSANKCFTYFCMHQFCLDCILEWSKVKAECPLCKHEFKSIIYNVKSETDYNEYVINTPEQGDQVQESHVEEVVDLESEQVEEFQAEQVEEFQAEQAHEPQMQEAQVQDAQVPEQRVQEQPRQGHQLEQEGEPHQRRRAEQQQRREYRRRSMLYLQARKRRR